MRASIFSFLLFEIVSKSLLSLKECFLDVKDGVSVLPLAAYVKKFREKLCIAQRMASENLQVAQEKNETKL